MGSLGKDAEDKKKKKKSWVSLAPPPPHPPKDAAINVQKSHQMEEMLLWPILFLVLMIVFFQAGRLLYFPLKVF